MNKIFDKLVGKAKNIVQDKEAVNKVIAQVKAKIDTLAEKDDRLGKMIREIRLFIRMVRAYMKGEYREIPVRSIVLIIAALLYFIMPLDLIPDFLPVSGFIDDLGVILWVGGAIRQELEDFQEWERHHVIIEEQD